MIRNAIRRVLGACALTAGAVPLVAFPQGANAQQAQQRFDIPAGELGAALDAFAKQAGVAASFDPALTRGKASAGLRGTFSVAEGFTRLLAGSGLERVVTSTGINALRAVDTGRTETLHEVVVEGDRAARQEGATKMPLSIRETPQAISVVTRASIEDRQVLDLGSAIELTAGVAATGKAFAGNNPRTGEGFTLRGQELDTSRDLRIDGFTAGGDRNNFDLAPFESVEVVKGPSSMLYGQGSLGGFINLVRKKPRAERSFKASTQAGSFDTYRAEVDVTGALSGSGTLLGQAALAYEDSGSFIHGVDSRHFVFAPGAEWSIGGRTRLKADVIHQHDRFSASLGIPLRTDGNTLRAPDVPRSFFFGRPSTEDSTASALHATLAVEHNFADDWLATLKLHRSRNQLLGIADSYGYGIDAFGDTSLYASYVGHDSHHWAGELRIDGKFNAFGRQHHLLVGIESNRLKLDAWGGYTGPIGTANIYDGSMATAPFVPARSLPLAYEGVDKGRNQGAYAQLLVGLRESTRLLLGARYDKARQSYQFNGDGESTSPHAFTTRIGLTQDFGGNLTGYAVYAESFNPVYGVSQQGALDPETGKGFEIGFKGEWLDGRFGVTAALFRQELDNRPLPDQVNGPPFQVSGGLQRSDGLELEVGGTPIKGWKIQAAAAWLDAEYIDGEDENYRMTPGGTIKRQISLRSEYEIQDGALQGFAFGATLLSVGDRIVLADQNYSIPGYERVDVNVSYSGLPNWKFSATVRNVADSKYVERPNSAYLYGHFYGSPRAYMLRVDYSPTK